MTAAVAFLQAVNATAALVAALFFMRFWRDNRDSLFGFFSAAFYLLSVSWAILALINPAAETQAYIYAIRLVAFGLLIVGMINKNRR
jgi:hypothetical protein